VVFQDARLHDRVHRAGFLAETAKYALRQIDVVSRGTPRSILALLGFDGNRQCRAYRFAQLAGYAALFSVRVSAQGMQTSEARRLRRLFFGKIHRDLPGEHVSPRQHHSFDELEQQESAEKILDSVHGFLLCQ
jgi:hypothetical protein